MQCMQAFWMMYLTTNLPALKAVAAPFVGSLAAPIAVRVVQQPALLLATSSCGGC
jgi:hypothetical protein